MADADSWDAENFQPEEPVTKAGVTLLDRWEGEDEDEDVKDNWDDEEEVKVVKENKPEVKTEVSQKKKLSEKIKEKEKKKQAIKDTIELSPDDAAAEKLRVKELQEAADLELANDAFDGCDQRVTFALTDGCDLHVISPLTDGGDLHVTSPLTDGCDLPVTSPLTDGCVPNSVPVVSTVTGIDTLRPSSKDDFTELHKLLKEKISQYESSVHYSNFLESLFRDLCISLEVDDLKKISTSLTVLLNEKQKQEKQNKAKKKKKNTVMPGGGLKAKLKDDLADYGEFAQDYEDFM
ncbi:eukaryotic translation initiation factor 3 subunit J-B isoform X5 [Conger conger]|uniref:eukaryotic translation initiation factor 3 subunit J-B isoform X5 n=1 Tax=Conger conger TaxID=82655 RepID=UPI002A59D9D7|nr:eukaryotic translation initiation factor 3 subunit J-B isoform X5 [Conger conger]